MKDKNIIRYKRNFDDPMPDHVRKELEAIKSMPDSEIDYSDAPPITDWSNSFRGWENRPRKKAISIRLDSDIIDYFKNASDKYQSAINQVLRHYVQSQKK